ncbi:adaptor protein MecA [Vagococcus vulneris]|uniref:Adapter protein MecA n=1 Tax=Vagococcus vulneris TaxID=1977869 RepID=A0A429ZYT8_9ENTE|nr:adaptor protein MecA [Vagococcus vulneris]RST99151.1 hypothetical protein CBF37_05650 [Vagococcus vulneris]
MEMERINENTIRVSIGSEDLEKRGVTFLDLLGNQKQIEGFFYSILEEVDVDDQFHETDAVTFQVLPNRDGLELFISKVTNSQEDPQLADENLQKIIQEKMPKVLDDDSDVVNEKDKNLETFDAFLQEYEDDDRGTVYSVKFVLPDFESLINLARHAKLDAYESNVFLYNKKYYLQVLFDPFGASDEGLLYQVARMYEFATSTIVTDDILEEYGELVLSDDALDQVNGYFNK